MTWIESGDPRAPIWLVGEAPGEVEIAQSLPFRGASGMELDRMLAEAGITRSDCFATNVCHIRPPTYTNAKGKTITNDIEQFFVGKLEARRRGLSEIAGRFPTNEIRVGLEHLHAIIRAFHPRLIIALGNTPMWALAGEMGITKWRGSILDTDHGKVIPTFHPADVLRQYAHRPIVVQDFRRAKAESAFPEVRRPAWRFVTQPRFTDVMDWLHDNPNALVADIETMSSHIDTIGFASSTVDAISIPFFLADGTPYWTEQEEIHLLECVSSSLTQRDITFHNAIYDVQVIANRWGIMPRLIDDTMAMQHVAFPGLLGGKIDPITGRVDKKGSSLSLSFISSMYCEYYRYWKDDGKLWDPAIHSPLQRWAYNCEDCVRTWECRRELSRILAGLNLTDQYRFEMDLFAPVFEMMFRGIRFDAARARVIRSEFEDEKARIGQWLAACLGHDFNPLSNPQCKALFYDDFKLSIQRNRKTGAATLDDGTLEVIGRQNPLLLPLVRNIQHYRTLDTVKGDVDPDMIAFDGRLHCDINVTYVETMRFSTNTNAFGEGRNLQNFKKPDED
jgi:DNA polymerase